MKRERGAYRVLHRVARIGNLGPLCMETTRDEYQWLLHEVYDLRFPHIGDDRHAMNGRKFDSLRQGFRARHRELIYSKHFTTVTA